MMRRVVGGGRGGGKRAIILLKESVGGLIMQMPPLAPWQIRSKIYFSKTFRAFVNFIANIIF